VVAVDRGSFLKITFAAVVVLSVAYPFLSGHWNPLIVLSDSMEPVMSSGDLIVYERAEAPEIEEGDILAFVDPSGRDDVIITHRVLDVEGGGELSFRTKGDAVNEPDPFTVGEGDVRGRVIAQIPYLGYLFHHSRSPYVLFLMVIFPAAVITGVEVKNISKYANPVKAARAEREGERAEREEKRRKTRTDFKRLACLFVAFLAIFGFISASGLIRSGYDVEGEEIGSGLVPKTICYSTGESAVPNHGVVSGGGGGGYRVEDAAVLSVAPAFIPPFWVETLGGVNPYLPSLLAIFGPSVLLVAVLHPFWRGKGRKGSPSRGRTGGLKGRFSSALKLKETPGGR